MKMGGFALGVESDVSVELEYDDMDELKEHPIASQIIGLTFNNIVSMAGLYRGELEDYSLPWTEVHEAIVNSEEYNAHKQMLIGVKFASALVMVLKALDTGASQAKCEFVHENLFTGSANVKTPGLGKASSLALNALFIKEKVSGSLAMIK